MKQPPSAAASGAPLLVNLAGSPFVNRRPVQRFATAAWVLGVLLAGVNVFLWLQYRHDSTALRDRLGDTRAAIDAKSLHLVEMNEELQGLGLAGQNAQVEFLNRRIAERTFPWSLLFERIGATLPDGVRILGVNPVFRERAEDRRRPSEAGALEDELVDFTFQGVARSDQDLYRLVDAFFSSPVFDAPRLHQETSSGGEVQFTVDVQYRPRAGRQEESHRPAIAVEEEEREAEEAAAGVDRAGESEDAMADHLADDDAGDDARDGSADSGTEGGAGGDRARDQRPRAGSGGDQRSPAPRRIEEESE